VTGPTPRDPLEQLAVARGVAVSYTDAFEKVRRVSPGTLVGVLAALGEPIERAEDAPECLARRAAQPRDPTSVVVAWDGRLGDATLRHFWDQSVPRSPQSPQPRPLDAAELRLQLEDGSDATELLTVLTGAPAVPPAIPFGLHRLSIRSVSALVISAPVRTQPLQRGSWGVFAPTYALIDERGGETGDLTCLERLGVLAGGLGAAYVSTLPLLADYSTDDEPDAVVSPYSPLSRMWWNEAYLDLARLPEYDRLGAGPEARPPGRLADVARAGAAVLASLARLTVPGDAARLESLRSFQTERPDVIRYAAFRAAARIQGPDRRAWPSRWRAGDIVPGKDVPDEDVNLHVLAQWLTDSQIAAVAASTSARGCRLMLDLPIGCRPDGYDTWAFPSSFAGGSEETETPGGVSVGAPPDRFFHNGQDWGFCPLDPEGERRAGYPVVRGALSHLLRHAGALRIDHVLGLQRLWWIPPGASPQEGAYVSYPSEELVALACLEAWRHGATLVGEDLGTVDESVRRLMADHGVAGMAVAVFNLEARPGRRLGPPAGSCALVDTHDTATFAGWLHGDDIDLRQELGLLGSSAAARARVVRSRATELLVTRLKAQSGDTISVLQGVLEELGSSEAGVVMATLEDLWEERQPQNIPGTGGEQANFTRRMARSLEAIEKDDKLLEPLRRLDRARAVRHAALDDDEHPCMPEGRGRVAS
jgi:4-alpha-glucanotransferase